MWLARSHALANCWKLMQLLGSALSHTQLAKTRISLTKLAEAVGKISPADARIRCCIWARCQRFRAEKKEKKGGRTSALLRSRAACRTWPHAVRRGLTVRATDHNRELTYGYFPRGSFDSSRSVALAMSYTYAYYDSRYNQFGSWQGLPPVRRASNRSIVTERTWLRWWSDVEATFSKIAT